MAVRPLPPGLPPLTLRGLAEVIYGADPPCVARPELFFGPDLTRDEPPGEHAARVAVARQVCGSCPVRLACLGFALRTRPGAGVWAGLDADAGELAYLTAAATRPPVKQVPAVPREVAA
jgi:Transcription factor WhiB